MQVSVRSYRRLPDDGQFKGGRTLGMNKDEEVGGRGAARPCAGAATHALGLALQAFPGTFAAWN